MSALEGPLEIRCPKYYYVPHVSADLEACKRCGKMLEDIPGDALCPVRCELLNGHGSATRCGPRPEVKIVPLTYAAVGAQVLEDVRELYQASSLDGVLTRSRRSSRFPVLVSTSPLLFLDMDEHVRVEDGQDDQAICDLTPYELRLIGRSVADWLAKKTNEQETRAEIGGAIWRWVETLVQAGTIPRERFVHVQAVYARHLKAAWNEVGLDTNERGEAVQGKPKPVTGTCVRCGRGDTWDERGCTFCRDEINRQIREQYEQELPAGTRRPSRPLLHKFKMRCSSCLAHYAAFVDHSPRVEFPRRLFTTYCVLCGTANQSTMTDADAGLGPLPEPAPIEPSDDDRGAVFFTNGPMRDALVRHFAEVRQEERRKLSGEPA